MTQSPGSTVREPTRVTESERPIPAKLVRRVHPPLADAVDGLFGRGGLWVVLWIILVALAFGFDELCARLLPRISGGGDIQRELAMLGQWGQFSSLVIVAVCMASLQPARWRRLLDLGLAALAVWFVMFVIKMTIGRLRPTHDMPYVFDGWLVQAGDAPEALSMYDFSSFPSSHTSGAVVLSVFFALCWPRLSIFALVMAMIVGFSRITFDAHWLSDVLVGATVGFLVGYPIMRYFCGVRLLDWLWRFVVDRTASPALPELIAEEERIEQQSG